MPIIKHKEQCSPSALQTYEENASCIDSPLLDKISSIFNYKNIDHNQLRQIVPECRNKKSDVCLLKNQKIKSHSLMKSLEARFRPERPPRWEGNAWLSGKEITNIMMQYETAHPTFEYMGTVAIDFASFKSNNTCVAKGMCAFDVAKRHGKSTFGMVINKDVHTGPGTHWVAMFCCTDRDHKGKYGVMYFCSYGSAPPAHAKAFMDLLVSQMDKREDAWISTHPWETRRKAVMGYNTKRYQYQTTECGIFSCGFIIRCLENLDETYIQSLDHIGTDDDCIKLRSVLSSQDV